MKKVLLAALVGLAGMMFAGPAHACDTAPEYGCMMPVPFFDQESDGVKSDLTAAGCTGPDCLVYRKTNGAMSMCKNIKDCSAALVEKGLLVTCDGEGCYALDLDGSEIRIACADASDCYAPPRTDGDETRWVQDERQTREMKMARAEARQEQRLAMVTRSYAPAMMDRSPGRVPAYPPGVKEGDMESFADFPESSDVLSNRLLPEPALLQKKSQQKPIDQMEEEVQAGKADAATINSLAWIYVTSPRHLNPKKGLELARRLVAANDGQTPQYYDTLATALAQNGLFTEAADVEATAITLSAKKGGPVKYFQKKKEIFENRLTYLQFMVYCAAAGK